MLLRLLLFSLFVAEIQLFIHHGINHIQHQHAAVPEYNRKQNNNCNRNAHNGIIEKPEQTENNGEGYY